MFYEHCGAGLSFKLLEDLVDEKLPSRLSYAVVYNMLPAGSVAFDFTRKSNYSTLNWSISLDKKSYV